MSDKPSTPLLTAEMAQGWVDAIEGLARVAEHLLEGKFTGEAVEMTALRAIAEGRAVVVPSPAAAGVPAADQKDLGRDRAVGESDISGVIVAPVPKPWRAADGQDLRRALVDLLRHEGVKPSDAISFCDLLDRMGWALCEVGPLAPEPPAVDGEGGK